MLAQPDNQRLGARHNLLLRSLGHSDASLLAPLMARVDFHPGEVLQLGDKAGSLVYFPETLVACLHGPDQPTGIGPAGIGPAGIGLVGCEGLVGWSALFDAGCRSGYHTGRVAISGGSALVIAAEQLRAVAMVSPTLAMALLRFVQTFIIQMSCTILSNLHQDIEVRVSAWVLMLHDRIEGDEITVTHGELAALLNVRRASITDALHRLEGERALRCTRGRMIVRDRARLEALAGSAYGASEGAYRSTIGPFGKSAATIPPGRAAAA